MVASNKINDHSGMTIRAAGFEVENTNGNGSVPQVIAASAVAASHTGSTAETALATITVPGGAMGANGFVRINTLWSNTNDASVKTLRIRWGGIGGTAMMAVAGTSLLSIQGSRTIYNRNSAASQVGFAASASTNTASAVNPTATVNTAADFTIVLTAELADGTDTATLEAYNVEVVYRP